MTTSAFLPRKPARCTGRPRRSGTSKSGAMREFGEPAAERLHFAEAPHARARLGDDRLAGLLRERGEVEVVAAHHVLRDRNAQIGAARALRFQLESVDARQIALADPQRAGDRASDPARSDRARWRDRRKARSPQEMRGGAAGRVSAPRRQRGGADDPQKIASFHGTDTTRRSRALSIWRTLKTPCLRASSSSTTIRIWSG